MMKTILKELFKTNEGQFIDSTMSTTGKKY